jgi:hypothetical protein
MRDDIIHDMLCTHHGCDSNINAYTECMYEFRCMGVLPLKSGKKKCSANSYLYSGYVIYTVYEFHCMGVSPLQRGKRTVVIYTGHRHFGCMHVFHCMGVSPLQSGSIARTRPQPTAALTVLTVLRPGGGGPIPAQEGAPEPSLKIKKRIKKNQLTYFFCICFIQASIERLQKSGVSYGALVL